MLIYYDMDTQSANFPQDAKQHLTVKRLKTMKIASFLTI